MHTFSAYDLENGGRILSRLIRLSIEIEVLAAGCFQSKLITLMLLFTHIYTLYIIIVSNYIHIKWMVLYCSTFSRRDVVLLKLYWSDFGTVTSLCTCIDIIFIRISHSAMYFDWHVTIMTCQVTRLQLKFVTISKVYICLTISRQDGLLQIGMLSPITLR